MPTEEQLREALARTIDELGFIDVTERDQNEFGHGSNVNSIAYYMHRHLQSVMEGL